MSLNDVRRVMSAIATPINATVNPVCAWDTRSTIAIIKITVLIMKSFIFSIASLGLGKVEGSTFHSYLPKVPF